MKAANLLVFRNQKIKLGDLGITIKLTPNAKMDEEFLIKGATPGYTTKEVTSSVEAGLPIPISSLFENDRFALIKTFQQLKNSLGE